MTPTRILIRRAKSFDSFACSFAIWLLCVRNERKPNKQTKQKKNKYKNQHTEFEFFFFLITFHATFSQMHISIVQESQTQAMRTFVCYLLKIKSLCTVDRAPSRDPECATRKVCAKVCDWGKLEWEVNSITLTYSVYLLNHELCFLCNLLIFY